jgi:hypothetical protein
MKLSRIDISGYASIKEKLKLFVDGRITTLIGANDTGKTNLLKAIRCLNDDAPFTEADKNWDLPEGEVPTIEWSFSITPAERTNLASVIQKLLKADGKNATVRDRPQEQALEITEVRPSPPADPDLAKTIMSQQTSVRKVPLPNEVVMRRTLGSKVDAPDLSGLAELRTSELVDTLLKMRPRVELFTPAEQLMDIITLAQLEQPEQEFMQGIFRYAGIWDERATLFRQGPKTEHRLMLASETFTEKIRKEWQQGEGLSFKLSHTGQNGDQIQLFIQDPAVGVRFVRPSERSEGFSSFFKMSMRLLARTSATPASSHLYLFDEPGTALHPAGQVNLQRVFERLSDDNQIIYATHSLFMINHNRPERNRVVSKGPAGTKIDQKPYLKNWRAVRDSLGLILAGTFFIADRTLLVEGESDAMYIGALLAAFDRAGLVDVDLNLFSVLWAGNARDFAPMARLLLEEGREVVALVDGDDGGKKLSRNIDKLNAEIKKSASILPAVVAITLPDHSSTEDLLPRREEYLNAVVITAKDLVGNGFRELPDGVAQFDQNGRLRELQAAKGEQTLGRHVEKVTEAWFRDKEAISKVAIARAYVSSLDKVDPSKLGVGQVPEPLRQIAEGLRLGSKQSDKAVFEKSK